MSIRHRLIAAAIALVVLLGAALALATRQLLLPHLDDIETSQALLDLRRVVHLLDLEGERLGQISREWGQWNDSYEFVSTRLGSYPQMNLSGAGIDRLGLDFLCVLDRTGRVVARGARTSLEASPLFREGSRLQLSSPNDSDVPMPAAWVNVGDAMALVATAPIVRDNGDGPSRGIMMAARLVDARFTRDLSARMDLKVTIAVLPEGALAPDGTSMSPAAIAAWTRLPIRADQHRSVEVAFSGPRRLHLLLEHSLWVLLVALLVIALAAGVIGTLYVDRILVRPLLTLRDQGERFGQTWSLESIHRSQRHDEIGALGRTLYRLAADVVEARGRLEADRNEFEHASLTDPMTGLGNRRALQRSLHAPETWGLEGLTLVVLDIDHFKVLNDTWGHAVGDACLVHTARLLRESSRGDDAVSRTGGEEFTVVCRTRDPDVASRIAERIRARVANTPFMSAETAIPITVSVGWIFLRTEGAVPDAKTMDALSHLADHAMYRCKRGGRNRWLGYVVDDSVSLDKIPSIVSKIDEALAEGLIAEKPFAPVDTEPRSATAPLDAFLGRSPGLRLLPTTSCDVRVASLESVR